VKDRLQLLEAYFKDIRDVYQTCGGVKEESYYGSLANLLNGIGKGLKPQVRCIDLSPVVVPLLTSLP